MKNLLGKSLIFSTLLKTIKEKGAAHILLLDPDKRDEESLEERVKSANNSGYRFNKAADKNARWRSLPIHRKFST